MTTIWDEASADLSIVYADCETCEGWSDHEIVKKALARGRKLEEERDVYEIALVKVSEWIKDEQSRHTKGKGGQSCGDTSPRMVPSALQELERLIRIDDARFTYEAMFEMQAKVDRYERALKTAWKELTLKGKTLPLTKAEESLLEDFSAALAEGEPIHPLPPGFVLPEIPARTPPIDPDLLALDVAKRTAKLHLRHPGAPRPICGSAGHNITTSWGSVTCLRCRQKKMADILRKSNSKDEPLDGGEKEGVEST